MSEQQRGLEGELNKPMSRREALSKMLKVGTAITAATAGAGALAKLANAEGPVVEKEAYEVPVVNGRATTVEKNPLLGLERGREIVVKGCGYRAMTPDSESISHLGINAVDNPKGERVRFLRFVRKTQADVFMEVAPLGPDGKYWMGNPVYMRVPDLLKAGVMGEKIETYSPEVKFDDEGRRVMTEEFISGASAENMAGMIAEGSKRVNRNGEWQIETYKRVVVPVIGENVRLPQETVVIGNGIETRLESPREDLPNGVRVVMVKHTIANE